MFMRDGTYQHAKAAKHGESSVSQGFTDFVAEFERKFHIAPLWVATDTIPVPNEPDAVRPRLDVVLERSDDYRKFMTAPFTFDIKKQARVARMFLERTSQTVLERAFQPPVGRTVAGDLFVVFSDFEKVAVQEVHGLVTWEELEVFAAGLGLGDSYWCIERYSGPPTVFVHTMEQFKALERSSIRGQWNDAYFELAKSKDEFGYLDRRTTSVRLDSKENFDHNYEGNWFYYWR